MPPNDPSDRDRLYAQARDYVSEFEFDESVARVFDDMISRSVPGYRTVIAMLGVIAQRYSRPGSNIYDLGCSLGAATSAMRRHLPFDDCSIIAVDNSSAMIAKARDNLRTQRSPVHVSFRCEDIMTTEIAHASIAVMNFTLQFIEPKDRFEMIKKLYDGLLPGGVLVLSEKIFFDDSVRQNRMTELHHAFKRANGYSDLEIAQKRSALENVLIPDDIDTHQARLELAGFRTVDVWFQCFNFVSLLAQK